MRLMRSRRAGILANGGDEHGILRPAGSQPALPALGRYLWLIPGHCDPTVNLHDFMIGVPAGCAGARGQNHQG
jgi:3-hydroxy-D-aspartate aldolase